MSHVMNYIPSLKTGSSLDFPVVMKEPFDLTEFIVKMEIKDDDEIAIGDFATMDANQLLDATGDQDVVVPVMVLDTVDNKAILEGHGLTVNKTSQFKDGDKIDVLILVPGVVLSVKLVASGTSAPYGSHLCTSGTAGQLKLLDVSANDEPAADLGNIISEYESGTGLAYAPMLVTA